MVFYYTIRGGQCRNEHSTIQLENSDIICYVGRDKHENEFLIKYGWPSDIWFHVEGLSSAHVYFRIKIQKKKDDDSDSNANANASSQSPLLSKLLAVNGNNITNLIPIDNIPIESIEDMCQIVKHNSISGCKMASCRIVYTPHSNLKKTFEMESGAVTYHNFKLQRFQRCNKDRQRVKELEKTKIERHNVQYFDEMKTNERLLIDLRKLYNRSHGGGGSGGAGSGSGGASTSHKVDIYDPMMADMRDTKSKATRQGDKSSGLDCGLSNLESLGLVAVETPVHAVHAVRGGGNTNSRNDNDNDQDRDQDNMNVPIWQKEYNERINSNERTQFLLARGYTKQEINTVMENSIGDIESFSITLAKLWNTVHNNKGDGSENNNDDDDNEEDFTKEQLYESRYEEREVLEAIYGEDEHVQFGWKNTMDDNDSDDDNNNDDDNDDDDEEDEDIDPTTPFSFDSIFPITGYEPPTRYEYPPPLLLEIYVDNHVSMYPYQNQSPILALVGGGIPSKYLRQITKQIYDVATERAQEAEPGEPYIFDILNLINDFTTDVLEEEKIELEQERKIAIKKAKEDAIKAAAAAKAKAKEDGIEEEEEDNIDVGASGASELKFKSDADRRAYAKSIVARGLGRGNGSGSGSAGAFDTSSRGNNRKPTKTKQDYSDDAAAGRLQEINDLFG